MTKKEMVTRMVNGGWYWTIVQDFRHDGYPIETAKRKSIDYITRHQTKEEIKTVYEYYELSIELDG